MDQEDLHFLRDFFQAVSDRALDPSHEYYVPIYDHKDVAEDDPVKLMARSIEWTPEESVQLFSGFRGTGKSTELRRLMRHLEDAGYLVVLCDIEDYVNLSTPIDVSDFLMAVVGAFGEAVAEPRFLDTHMVLCYRNGHEWYDVHPLIAEIVERQAERRRARSPSTAPE